MQMKGKMPTKFAFTFDKKNETLCIWDDSNTEEIDVKMYNGIKTSSDAGKVIKEYMKEVENA